MKPQKLTYMALLTAVALIIFVIEAQIPAPVPIPGVKLGLANIITVYAMFVLAPKEVLMILLCRILLGAVFAGQMTTLMYSLSGGILCFAVMLAAKRFLSLDQIWVCSVLGAIAHNIGQLICAILVVNTIGLIVYLPALLISAVIAGTFTGFAAQYLLKRMGKLQK